ncbi:hypothetical protein D3C75_1108060 [compost metagenome]
MRASSIRDLDHTYGTSTISQGKSAQTNFQFEPQILPACHCTRKSNWASSRLMTSTVMAELMPACRAMPTRMSRIGLMPSSLL